jgi:hypothetical protein
LRNNKNNPNKQRYYEEDEKKKKKTRLRGRRRDRDNPNDGNAPPPNPNDYISSYLTTGSVPDPNFRLRTTKRRGSLGGLKDSGNSASEWKEG